MSWSASLGEPRPAAEIEPEKFTFTPQAGLERESQEQFELAVAKAKSIAHSGALGDESKSFYVTLSGHANENHEPAKGWSNDALTVLVSQA